MARTKRPSRQRPRFDQHELCLTGKTDPVLAELWDNPKDDAYDNLRRFLTRCGRPK